MKSRVNTVMALILSIIMVFSCVWISNAADSTGGEDISEEAVDSIKVTDKYGVDTGGTVENWDDFRVVVTFSEDNADGSQKSGLDIRGGDTITISWKAPKGIEFKGYSNTFYLYADKDGTQEAIATVVISNDMCKITFNDNVNSLQHVSCTLYFKIEVSGDLNASDATGKIYSGDLSTDVNVVEAESSSSSVFSHKSATYETDGSSTIIWSIWLNEDYRTDLTGDIVIKDTLPETETFQDFYYTSRNKDGKWEWIAKTLDQFNKNNREFKIEGNTIVITIPADDMNNTENPSLQNTALNTPLTGLIVIKTTSTASAGETVNNTAEVTYTSGSETITDTDKVGVAVPLSNGTVTGTSLGRIEITNVVTGTTNPVEGVTFRAYKVKSESDHTRVTGWNNGTDYKEVTTNENGIASVSDLTDGVYELVEVTDDLPEWIAEPGTTSRYMTVEGTDKDVTIENSVKTGDITATKKWTQNDGTTADTSDHETVYFKLYRSVNGGDAEAVNNAEIKAVTMASGESTADVTWEDLPLYDDSGNKYTYSVKEVDSSGNDYTPSGYLKKEDGLTVTNVKDITYSDVTAVKKWVEHDGTTADTSSHPTVYFKLYRSVSGGDTEAVSGAEIKKIKTAAGKSSTSVTWTDLPETNSAGQEYTYSVKEVDAGGNDYTPEGYTRSEDGLIVINRLKKSSASTNTTDESNSIDSGKSDDNAKTGDTSGIALWVSLLIISAAVVAVIFYRKRRNDR